MPPSLFIDHMTFKTKKALRDAVREIVSQHDFYDEFESELLSDLFLERHYYCSEKRIRPTRFRKAWRNGFGYDFEVLMPDSTWRVMSWNKAVDGKTFEDHCREALRAYCRSDMDAQRLRFPICQICHLREAIDTHHENPTFREIAERCLRLITPEDRAYILDNMFESGDITKSLPQDHPACRLSEIIHKTAVLIAVCKPCHRRLER